MGSRRGRRTRTGMTSRDRSAWIRLEWRRRSHCTHTISSTGDGRKVDPHTFFIAPLPFLPSSSVLIQSARDEDHTSAHPPPHIPSHPNATPPNPPLPPTRIPLHNLPPLPPLPPNPHVPLPNLPIPVPHLPLPLPQPVPLPLLSLSSLSKS